MRIDGEDIFKWFVAISVSVLFCFGFWGIYKHITSDGKINYCYVATGSPENCGKMPYRLYGHREFRSDLSLGTYDSMEEVVKNAGILNCEIKVK